jgi:hypothetical protein
MAPSSPYTTNRSPPSPRTTAAASTPKSSSALTGAALSSPVSADPVTATTSSLPATPWRTCSMAPARRRGLSRHPVDHHPTTQPHRPHHPRPPLPASPPHSSPYRTPCRPAQRLANTLSMPPTGRRHQPHSFQIIAGLCNLKPTPNYGSTLTASRWLLIGNQFLRNNTAWKVTENTIMSHAALRHVR